MRPTRRDLLALTAGLAAAPALAQTPGQTPAAATSAAELTSVTLTTPLGRVVFGLETRRAPLTSANFLKYVDLKLYDGATFYRASRPPGSVADNFGLVEGGLQSDPAKVLAPIPHESTRVTGLAHVDGTISMARYAPGTAQGDFFVCLGDQAYLDADQKDASAVGFAAFGRVTEGMAVMKQILTMPVDPNRGEGAMKEELLVNPVPILTARRT
jgi:peptidyl-prolyl cis-trans isomerase A (cyclophilin A)